jgi:hypothetical protein
MRRQDPAQWRCRRGVEAGFAVILKTAEDNSDDARTVFAGSGTKQNVNSGAMAVFARAAQRAHFARLKKKMMIRVRYIDVRFLDGLVVYRLGCGKRPPAREKAVKMAREIGGEVNYDKDRSRKIWRKAIDNGSQSIDAAGGPSDNNNVSDWQGPPAL